MTYSDGDIDDAIERIAADVTRRTGHADFPAPVIAALVDELRRMEAARRAGDAQAAERAAAAAGPGLEKYRPTNATSRSKALIGEVVAALLAPSAPPD
jgi:hypothetical protein